MMEFILAFFVTVAAIEITANTANAAYEYVEPKVTEGVEYIKDKISPEEQE